jgi:hypothetical protein
MKSQGLGLEDSQMATADRLLKLAAVAAKAACVIMQLVQERDGTHGLAASVAFEEGRSTRSRRSVRRWKERRSGRRTRIRRAVWHARPGSWRGLVDGIVITSPPDRSPCGEARNASMPSIKGGSSDRSGNEM